jgi:glycosyltransferase involved in cell wall biosynthesis
VYNARHLVVHFLTEELVRRGHATTLFAAAGSRTSAALVTDRHAGARGHDSWDIQARELEYMGALEQRAGDFDVVHFHTDPIHLPLAARLGCAHLTTMHGTLSSEDHGPLFSEFPATPIVSTSSSQRRSLPWLDWRATIPYGLPASLLRFNPCSAGYLLFIDDIAPDSGVEIAIDIARRISTPLKIAGTLHPENQPYFRNVVQPALSRSGADAEFIGKVKIAEHWRLLTGARALLVTGSSADIGGMSMIEAAACGTPVIALRCGAAKDIVEDGVSGRLVNNYDEAMRAALLLTDANRSDCRRVFETRFTIDSMAEAYMQVYSRL